MIYLKKYVKFRKESGFILVCNCSDITNYELPLKFWDFLVTLKKGYDDNKTSATQSEKEKLDLIKDLKKLDLLSNKKDSNEGFNEAEWVSLDYTESELFTSA